MSFGILVGGRERVLSFAGLVALGGELGFGGDGDLGAAGVDGMREGLDEALGGAGDEGELDVDPVGAGGVVDDGPALEGGGLHPTGRSAPGGDPGLAGGGLVGGRLLARGWGSRGLGVGEEDAVGGLPDGDLGEVGDAEVAAAAGGAFVEEGEVAEAAAAAPVEELEVVGEVGEEVSLGHGGGGGGAVGGRGSVGGGVGVDGADVDGADLDREEAAGEAAGGEWTSTRAPRMLL